MKGKRKKGKRRRAGEDKKRKEVGRETRTLDGRKKKNEKVTDGGRLRGKEGRNNRIRCRFLN